MMDWNCVWIFLLAFLVGLAVQNALHSLREIAREMKAQNILLHTIYQHDKAFGLRAMLREEEEKKGERSEGEAVPNAGTDQGV